MMKYFKALPDTDGDGLHDAEEDYGWTVKRDINGDGDTNDDIYYGGVLYYKETLLPYGEGGEVWSSWTNQDSDSDGLNDKEEKEHYTYPQFGDTDHDGLPDSLDTMNPLTNLKISFNIKEILQLDPVDDGSGSDADKDNTPGDFYLKIKMDTGGEITWKNTAIPIEKDNAHITSPQKLVFPVDDNIEEVTFTVYLYDDDSGTGELCDILPSANYSATLNYSLKNGTWWGDDFVSFSRYRHLNGTMDGSNTSDENDCDILFRIDLSDVDGDGVTYWDEVNRYHTNPISDDTDNDGLKDGEEIFIYGINPNDPDIDDDGIPDGNDWIAPPEWGYKDELILVWIYFPPEAYPMLRKMIKFAISSGVKVRINVYDEKMRNSCRENLTTGEYALQSEVVHNNIIFKEGGSAVARWVRDYGPQFTVNSSSSTISIINWSSPSYLCSGEYPYEYYLNMNDTSRFRYVDATTDVPNLMLEGGAFQADGNGYGYVSTPFGTEQRENITRVMGLKEIRFLEAPPSISRISNHLDMYTYIASSHTVILSSFPDSKEDNDTMNEIANSFKEWGFKVLSIPTPSVPNITYTYTNALVLNDVVFIPSYSNFSEDNQAAKNIFKEAFPDRTIVPINADPWIKNAGAIHCLSITRPWVSSSNEGAMP